MRRSEVTHGPWELVAGLMPHDTRRGGRWWRDHRQVLNGVFWVLHTGAPWRERPDRCGPWKTAYNRFTRWRRERLFERVLERLQLRLDADGRLAWDLFCVDGTSVRASRSGAGAGKGGLLRPGPSPPTTRWAARAAGGAPSSTWSWTGTASRWPPPSPPARRARASRSSR